MVELAHVALHAEALLVIVAAPGSLFLPSGRGVARGVLEIQLELLVRLRAP